MMMLPSLDELNQQVIACQKCPRLREYCHRVAQTKRRAYRDQDYWGKPVPGFGDPAARLVIVGLAPGAHGSNRTGRMFTGDASGNFLYAALHQAGFCNQPISRHREDGLRLYDVYITAVARCAPPGNKPLPIELENCLPYLQDELRLLKNAKVVLALGKIAFEGALKAIGYQRRPGVAKPEFAHGAAYSLSDLALVSSYHVSQQNTQTGRLTMAMLMEALATCRLRMD